ncbi:MAG TPA: hypothetical protein VD741_09085, partial [Solirubrobacterales bacterium]|nr:hypothetical protein [Solirubrobacterales bacterium]
MLSKLRPRLSYANVVATLALFCALAGGAYAAGVLPKNSVGTKQLKKNAVTGAKVKDGSLRKQDFRAGELPAGPQGPTGPAGPAGAPGQPGPRGPSNAYVDSDQSQISIGPSGTLAAQLKVPAGSWALSAYVMAFENGASLASVNCTLFAGPTTLVESRFRLESSSGANEAPIPAQGVATVTGP